MLADDGGGDADGGDANGAGWPDADDPGGDHRPSGVEPQGAERGDVDGADAAAGDGDGGGINVADVATPWSGGADAEGAAQNPAGVPSWAATEGGIDMGAVLDAVVRQGA